MNETFKINVHFDEKGEEIEKLISHLLILSSMERRKNAWWNRKINISSSNGYIRKK